MRNKVVFFGTPWFAAEVLRYLFDSGMRVVGVVTQPDRPKGRSLQVTPSPVKQLVEARGQNIPVLQPEKASNDPFLDALQALKADLFVVVAYGQILPQKLLDIPPLGCINVHASLLPKYRGAAPIQRCLMAGEKKTGISIQKMVLQLDAGDVIAVSHMEIPPEMTYGELEKALCEQAKPLLMQVLELYEHGIPSATAQDPTLASYASKVAIEEGEIHWNDSAEAICNRIRALSPRPGAWAWQEIGKKKVKILRARVVDQEGAVGVLLEQKGVVGCGQQAIELIEVQPEGKRVMTAIDWLRGASTFNGVNLRGSAP